MRLQSDMHPRNRYAQEEPDFAALASKYPDFSQYVSVSKNTNRGHINFKNPHALRSLYVTCMKEHFKLDVDVPIHRLIPTLPLRLNYIHWVEDLLCISRHPHTSGVTGIDIGCGSSAVYALLGASMFSWSFVATDIDPVNLVSARTNVSRNNLVLLVDVQEGRQDTFFHVVTTAGVDVFDFSMCNPPFFSDETEVSEGRTRSSSRIGPRSVCTGSSKEVVATGGEFEFVSAMVAESQRCAHKVRWFTSMLGKKVTLVRVLDLLRSHSTPCYGYTVLSQGRTTRWAVAWSFYKCTNYVLFSSVVHLDTGKEVTIRYQHRVSQEDLTTRLDGILRGLAVHLQPSLSTTSSWEVVGEAFEDRWSRLNRKRLRKCVAGGCSDDPSSCPQPGSKQRPQYESELSNPFGTSKLNSVDGTPCQLDANKGLVLLTRDPPETGFKCIPEVNTLVSSDTCWGDIPQKSDSPSLPPPTDGCTEQTSGSPASGRLFLFRCRVDSASNCDHSITYQCLQGSRDKAYTLFQHIKNKLSGTTEQPTGVRNKDSI